MIQSVESRKMSESATTSDAVAPPSTDIPQPNSEYPPTNDQVVPPDSAEAPPITLLESETPPTTSPQPADTSETSTDENSDIVHSKATPEQATPPSGQGASPKQTTPPPVPDPIFHESWSKLSREVIIDKIKGIIYGQAIGDALGLATEFLTKKEAVNYYGVNGPEEYSQIINDFHRSRWAKGDWTDDTDQLLLILQMIVERNGTVDKGAFAKKMISWRHNGFIELGDQGGMGIGMTVSQTLSHHNFLTGPHEAAREVWERSGRYLAANGAIMRTAILGTLEFNKIDRVVANTREVCHVTHADPRCLASCIAVTTAIALMLQGTYDPHKKNELEKLVEEAINHAKSVLKLEDQKKELKKHMRVKKLKELDLENRSTMGYTFKALGAGFYGLRTESGFKPTIKQVIMEAGDADSNAAVCGALMGCRIGFSGLPEDLLRFPNRKWLDTQVEEFLRTIGLQ